MNPQMAIRKPVSPTTSRMYLSGRKEAAFRDLWRPIGLEDDDDGAFWRHLEPFSDILAVCCPLEPEIEPKKQNIPGIRIQSLSSILKSISDAKIRISNFSLCGPI
jgi:hypothetical protein